MKKYKLNFGEISNELSFHDSLGADRYFCKCGGYLKVEQGKGEFEEKEEIHYDDDYDSVITNYKLHSGVKLLCPLCKNNFSVENIHRKLIKTNTYFLSGYVMEEDEVFLKLYYSKVKGSSIPRFNSREQDMEVVFIEDLSYISFNKQTKELFYKTPFSKERSFDLDEIIDIVNEFFTLETQVVLNLINLHLYVSKLAKHVSDSKNIDVVNELISRLRGQHNSAGTEIFKVIISIFLGIIKYSNLSTIALVKNTEFLYDLMKECKIPKPDILKNEEATSPLEIFNFLTQNYIKILNEEINEDNKNVHAFVYKGKKLKDLGENLENIDKLEIEGEDSELKITFKENKKYKEGKVEKTESGYRVIDNASNRKISKSLFKVIRNFNDYQKLIRYLKFLSYEELLDLVNKNQLDFLKNIIDIVYFRDNMNYEELKRLIPIFYDFAKIKTYEFKPSLKEEEVDFSFLKNFSFVDYDDTLLMLESLKFDPKKEFYKIKTYNHLKSFHDSVVMYYNAMSDAEKNGDFRNFVSKFRFLEEKNLYNGPLSVKILSSPVLVIKEGNDMKHSGGSYVRRIMNGQYILLQVFDNTINIPKEENVRFTLGLFYDEKTGLEFDQVKGPCNIQGSDRFKKEMMNYLETMEISYRPLRDLKLKGE